MDIDNARLSSMPRMKSFELRAAIDGKCRNCNDVPPGIMLILCIQDAAVTGEILTLHHIHLCAIHDKKMYQGAYTRREMVEFSDKLSRALAQAMGQFRCRRSLFIANTYSSRKDGNLYILTPGFNRKCELE
jgi:hypothetical protein